MLLEHHDDDDVDDELRPPRWGIKNMAFENDGVISRPYRTLRYSTTFRRVPIEERVKYILGGTMGTCATCDIVVTQASFLYAHSILVVIII